MVVLVSVGDSLFEFAEAFAEAFAEVGQAVAEDYYGDQEDDEDFVPTYSAKQS